VFVKFTRQQAGHSNELCTKLAVSLQCGLLQDLRSHVGNAQWPAAVGNILLAADAA
jgi:hypothetical protein